LIIFKVQSRFTTYNTKEEKRRLKGCCSIENYIRRPEEKGGENFSMFRRWAAVKAVIVVVELNLWF
jgi:hypothetical protein